LVVVVGVVIVVVVVVDPVFPQTCGVYELGIIRSYISLLPFKYILERNRLQIVTHIYSV